jgi:hypothetical protein
MHGVGPIKDFEPQRGPAPIVNQRRHDDFRILNRQVTMFEQKFHRLRKCRGIAIVKGSEYPQRFGEYQMGNPSAG